MNLPPPAEKWGPMQSYLYGQHGDGPRVDAAQHDLMVDQLPLKRTLEQLTDGGASQVGDLPDSREELLVAGGEVEHQLLKPFKTRRKLDMSLSNADGLVM